MVERQRELMLILLAEGSYGCNKVAGQASRLGRQAAKSRARHGDVHVITLGIAFSAGLTADGEP